MGATGKGASREASPSLYADSTPTYPTDGARPLFEVVVKSVVGTVYAGDQYPARVAAFLLIAESGLNGVFEFPTEDGRVERVTVVQVDAAE